MPPTFVTIRHAQALHNVSKDYELHDPPLTETGHDQCAALRQNLMARFSSETTSVSDVALIVSPMRRTLETALRSLDWLIDRGVKIEPDAEWQENSAKPCDTGSPLATIATEFPSIDFSAVDPVYPDKTSPAGRPYAHSRTAIVERGRRCLDALYARPERLIFIVSHSGFMRAGLVGRRYFNADYRIFRFAAHQPQEANSRKVAVQDESTLTGGMDLSLAEEVELGDGLPDDDGES